MIKVLFVCLGNICRSPLAEGVFQAMVNDKKLSEAIHCDSAGTSSWHVGDAPDTRSINIALKYNIELEHYGRQVNKDDFYQFHYIIAMDDKNLNDINALDRDRQKEIAKVLKMRYFDVEGKGRDVPDPYYGGIDGFEKVYRMLDRSCSKLLDHLIKEHKL